MRYLLTKSIELMATVTQQVYDSGSCDYTFSSDKVVRFAKGDVIELTESNKPEEQFTDDCVSLYGGIVRFIEAVPSEVICPFESDAVRMAYEKLCDEYESVNGELMKTEYYIHEKESVMEDCIDSFEELKQEIRKLMDAQRKAARYLLAADRISFMKESLFKEITSRHGLCTMV